MAGRETISWDDLRLFLDVARLGGLTAATATTKLSAATLGRRVTALEHHIGEPLFIRRQTGYELTRAGVELLERTEDVEAAMRGVLSWREGNIGEKIVRISAGAWTSHFISRHIGRLWRVEDGLRIELVTAYEKVDIGRRAADIGVRSERPVEPTLAGRKIGTLAHALYCAPRLVNGVAAAMFVGATGEAARIASARWLMAHHGDRIGVRGNDVHAVRELVAAGAGIGVLPCFVGDDDPRIARIAGPIAELETEQWLVTHHEDRHRPEVRRVAERLAGLLRQNADLFRGARKPV